MKKDASVVCRAAAAVIAVLVALPLAAWAAASSPVPIGASMTASRSHGTLPVVHRRVRRHRQRWAVRGAVALRAFSANAGVPPLAAMRGSDPLDSFPAASDLPPPDYPPA